MDRVKPQPLAPRHIPPPAAHAPNAPTPAHESGYSPQQSPQPSHTGAPSGSGLFAAPQTARSTLPQASLATLAADIDTFSAQYGLLHTPAPTGQPTLSINAAEQALPSLHRNYVALVTNLRALAPDLEFLRQALAHQQTAPRHAPAQQLQQIARALEATLGNLLGLHAGLTRPDTAVFDPVTKTLRPLRRCRSTGDYLRAVALIRATVPILRSAYADARALVDRLYAEASQALGDAIVPDWRACPLADSRVRLLQRIAQLLRTGAPAARKPFLPYHADDNPKVLLPFAALNAAQQYLAAYCRLRPETPLRNVPLALLWEHLPPDLLGRILHSQGHDSALRALDSCIHGMLRTVPTPMEPADLLADVAATLAGHALNDPRRMALEYARLHQRLRPLAELPYFPAIARGLHQILTVGVTAEQRTTLLKPMLPPASAALSPAVLAIYAGLGDRSLAPDAAVRLLAAQQLLEHALPHCADSLTPLARRAVLAHDTLAGVWLGALRYHAEHGAHPIVAAINTVSPALPVAILHLQLASPRDGLRTVALVDLCDLQILHPLLANPAPLATLLAEYAEGSAWHVLLPHSTTLDALVRDTASHTALEAALRHWQQCAPDLRIVFWQPPEPHDPIPLPLVTEIPPEAICPGLRPPPRSAHIAPDSPFSSDQRQHINELAAGLTLAPDSVHTVCRDVAHFLERARSVPPHLLRDADQRAWFFEGAPPPLPLLDQAIRALHAHIRQPHIRTRLPILRHLVAAGDEAALGLLGIYSRLARGTIGEPHILELLREGQALQEQYPGIERTAFLALLDDARRGLHGSAAELGYIVRSRSAGHDIEALNPSRVLADHHGLTCDYLETVPQGKRRVPRLVELKLFSMDRPWDEQMAWIRERTTHGVAQLRESAQRYGSPIDTQLVALFPNLLQDLLTEIRGPKAALQANARELRDLCDTATAALQAFAPQGTLVLGTYRARPDAPWYELLHLAPFAGA